MADAAYCPERSGPMKVEIYSDIACPWCYIGHKRFRTALEELSPDERPEVVFRPYQLDPSLPQTPVPVKERLRERYGDLSDSMTRQAAEVGAQEGLEMRFDIAQAVNTFTAHRLLHHALSEYGAETQGALAEKLFESHFSEGANVADPVYLADAAARVGMDKARTEAFLASSEGRDAVRRGIEYAQRLGIRAVPTFVFDSRYAVQGAHPTDTFRGILEEITSAADASQDAGG